MTSPFRASVESKRVLNRAVQLLAEQPHLATADPRSLFSRMAVPATVIDYESAVTRAAMGLLLACAVDRAEQASPFTGDAA